MTPSQHPANPTCDRPRCGSPMIPIRHLHTVGYDRDGRAVRLPVVTGHRCPSCGYAIAKK